MRAKRGKWYIGFDCEGCKTRQTILEDPDRGKGKYAPHPSALNPATGRMESVMSPQKIAISCAGWRQPNVLPAKDLRRWQQKS